MLGRLRLTRRTRHCPEGMYASLLLAVALTSAPYGYHFPDPHGTMFHAASITSAIAGASAATALAIALKETSGSRWTVLDTSLELTFLVLTTVDMMQTSEFRSRGEVEVNPLLGRYPSQQEVTLGIGAMMLGHVVVAALLPKPYRTLWQGGAIGIEMQAIGHNYRCGVGLKVPW